MFTWHCPTATASATNFEKATCQSVLLVLLWTRSWSPHCASLQSPGGLLSGKLHPLHDCQRLEYWDWDQFIQERFDVWTIHVHCGVTSSYPVFATATFCTALMTTCCSYRFATLHFTSTLKKWAYQQIHSLDIRSNFANIPQLNEVYIRLLGKNLGLRPFKFMKRCLADAIIQTYAPSDLPVCLHAYQKVYREILLNAWLTYLRQRDTSTQT